MTQEELLQLIKRKDQLALAALYDRYGRSLFAIIFHQVRHRERAEEILEEAFARIWKNIGHYSSADGRLFTWLVAQTRKTLAEQKNTVADAEAFPNFIHMQRTPRFTGQVDSIGANEFAKRLKPKCIQTFELLFFRAKSPSTTATELGLTEPQVVTQNRQCLLDLRNFLES